MQTATKSKYKNMSYNIVKCRYQKTLESGRVKYANESYIVDCLSKTEGEVRIIEELTPIYPDLQIKSIGESHITQIFGDNEAERFYLAKVAFITIDEKTAAEKRTVSQILVGAKDFDDALQIFKDGMKDTMADWELVSLAETQIMQVYPAKLG